MSGAVAEVRTLRPGMMALVSLAISTAYFYSLTVTFGLLSDMLFYWELATLVIIMLLGHWMEMRASGSAQSALTALAERFAPDGSTSRVLVSELQERDLVLVRPGAQIPADGRVEFVTNINNLPQLCLRRLSILTVSGLLVHNDKVTQAVEELKKRCETVPEEYLPHITPLGWEHINLIGQYSFSHQSAVPWTISDYCGFQTKSIKRHEREPPKIAVCPLLIPIAVVRKIEPGRRQCSDESSSKLRVCLLLAEAARRPTPCPWIAYGDAYSTLMRTSVARPAIYQIVPFGPAVIYSDVPPITNSLIFPWMVMRPILACSDSINQRAPSGPVV
ncbi:MAG: Tn3 family transposase, partial [Ktedonobacteraceae bacterium]|nr:Tn3 family transposase [Ktedonobacteraceae bacterium]